ncbi:MAG TPA: anhydro-N-acetylmuramic acid kinase [Aliidongia sp.]|uniref:anhydro-N-acetylmuramic acid kinase n=1 Tax=Aliidongia sp. TaxID=1914230 RepID=UPI002DDC9F15|nr:anhydro-N-acetylmuramic acid kinase [Aliidongia sp.]HEV2674373.1 anhydro-N-acetylmuramic acid kinase [Aliidongia sp.]
MRAIGLMSGTSLDGIDAALVDTDGLDRVATGPSLTVPYPGDFRDALRAILGQTVATEEIRTVERRLTELHAEAVGRLRADHGLDHVDLIGFHGHTILHRPDQGRTWQIGDGGLLARLTGVPVVSDFRTADVAAGGEGAPLVPVYHRALVAGLAKPLAILNIGGVANITWIGPGADDLVAFDTGPGNAPIDDWMRAKAGAAFDAGGETARRGTIDHAFVGRFLEHAFFARRPPKSLDRDDFARFRPDHLNAADGAATLAACTVAAALAARGHLPTAPLRWLVTGGGRHNRALMDGLAAGFNVPVEPVDVIGWDGDALEAQAFGYLAVRSLAGLPLSFPGTTRVPRALTGGRLDRPPVF